MKLTLGKKLGLGFGSILALMVFSAALAHVKADASKRNESHEFNMRFPSISALKDLQRDLNQAQSEGHKVIFAGSEKSKSEAAKKAFDGTWADIEEQDTAALDVLAPQWSLQSNRDKYAELKERLPALRGTQEAAMTDAASGERDAVAMAGKEFIEGAGPITEAIKKSLGDLVDSHNEFLQHEIDQIDAEKRSTDLTMALSTVAALGMGIFVALFLSHQISRASRSVLVQAEAIAAGDLTREDLQVRSRDELGDLTNAINTMSSSLRQMILAITENAVRVASASQELNATSERITANSEETSAQADVVSKAAQSVSDNLQTVATGTEEMGASIKEIAKNAGEAARVATSAVQVAETTTATVSKLGDSSSEIGQVVKVITSIAQQTNLLALNATIEAARAGEAGKGFAVVANEVKELAKQTAKATEDISRKIEAIQTDTKAAVDAISSISAVIHQVNDISSTIATAVEEQYATTNEMARNVGEAAHGSGEITHNIAGVAEAAQGTTRGAADTQKAAQQLVETSSELRSLIEQFKLNVDGSAGRTLTSSDKTRTRTTSRAAHA